MSTANVKPQDVFKRPAGRDQFGTCEIAKALPSQRTPCKVRRVVKPLKTACSVQVPFHFPTLMAAAQTSREKAALDAHLEEIFLTRELKCLCVLFFFSLFLNLKLHIFGLYCVGRNKWPPPPSFSLKMTGICLCRHGFGERAKTISLRSSQHVRPRHELVKRSHLQFASESLAASARPRWGFGGRPGEENGSRWAIYVPFVPGEGGVYVFSWMK